jgi:spore coat protein JB
MPAETTELRELMALDFVTAELNLYLDTHSSDTQAFQTLQSFLKMYEEGRKEYVARFGPLSLSDLATAKSYTWLNDPWPWDYVSKEG